jgi:RAD50-interacting protein 1
LEDHYRNLSSFSQKLRFLIDIQTNILDMFHERLADSMRTYVARTTTIGRTSREDQAALQGLPGLETLCKIYGSTDYLENSMRDWSEDVFFLELWSELQYRAEHRERGKPVVGGMTLAEVALRTSNTVGTEDGETSGSIFDEPAASYNRLRVRVEAIIVELLQNNIKQSLGAYQRINPWSTLAPTSSAQPLSPTAELDTLISSLSTLFAFLAKALAPLPLRRIARQAVQTIDHQLLDQVLLRHSFSTAGATQLAADVNAIRSVLDRYVGGAVGEWGLGRCSEAVKLLSVPVKGSRGEVDDGTGDDGKKREWGLWEVERHLIGSGGDEAREFLINEMGIERLSVTDARKILSRKVELGS